MRYFKKLILNIIDTFHIYFYIFREILVNYFFYKLKIRRFLGRGKINNVTGNLNSDFYDKGIKHSEIIHQLLESITPKISKGRFLEFGPGGTLLNGLMLIVNGWKEYYAVDTFPSEVWSTYPQKLYNHYIDNLKNRNTKAFATKILHSSINLKGPLFYFPKDGVTGRTFSAKVQKNSIDFIYSWGVLEHVNNPYELFEKCFHLLKLNGCVLHVIDFHPHTWNRFKKTHYFLSIPDWLWSMMYSERGFINRLRASSYIQFAKKAGFNIKIIKIEYSKSDISSYKKLFQNKFKKLKSSDILTDRVYMLLTKQKK